MKKLVYTLFLLAACSFSQAQNCTPDQNLTDPGSYPSKLPPGTAGSYYEETVQFVIPADTQIIYNGVMVQATIDSIKVINVEGLPNNLGYVCNPSSCVLPGGQTSCGVMYGTIDSSESGTYPLLIPITVYGRVGGSFPVQQKDTLKSLSMSVLGPNAVNEVSFKKAYVYPNPAPRQARILLPESAENMTIKLVNAAGKEMTIEANISGNEISIATQYWPKGVYIGTISSANSIYRFQIIRP